MRVRYGTCSPSSHFTPNPLVRCVPNLVTIVVIEFWEIGDISAWMFHGSPSLCELITVAPSMTFDRRGE